MEKLHQDFKDFLSLLNSHHVSYLLVGGYAVTFHGYPRFTGDMDIWVAATEENAKRIVAVLKEFGFDLPELSKEMFLDDNRMTRLGREPVKIKILNSISGVDFSDAKPRAFIVDVGDISVPVISLSDLRKNKAAAARPKDLADLDNLPEPEEKEQN